MHQVFDAVFVIVIGINVCRPAPDFARIPWDFCPTVFLLHFKLWTTTSSQRYSLACNIATKMTYMPVSLFAASKTELSNQSSTVLLIGLLPEIQTQDTGWGDSSIRSQWKGLRLRLWTRSRQCCKPTKISQAQAHAVGVQCGLRRRRVEARLPCMHMVQFCRNFRSIE